MTVFVVGWIVVYNIERHTFAKHGANFASFTY